MSEPWREAILLRRRAEEMEGAKMFLGIPERWLDDPSWRCAAGHVSKFFLKSEEHGDRCLAAGCGASVMLTHPEDRE